MALLRQMGVAAREWHRLACTARWLATRGDLPPGFDERQLQPLSRAVARLEAVVLAPALPAADVEANRTALTSLKGFLSSLSNPTSYPAAGIKNVAFALPARGGKGKGGTERVRCQLKTTGGDCSRLVAANLGALLQRSGIDPNFFFDRDEFNPRPPPPPPRKRPAPPPGDQPGDEPSLGEVAKVRAEAAAAGFPSQMVTEEEFRELEAKQQGIVSEKEAAAAEADDWSDKVKRLDPLFGAVAAVPWMPRDADGQQRAQYIKSTVLDELEAQGWDLRGAALSIWSGERKAARLTRGKDPGSSAAIQSLLFHALKYDTAHGKKVMGE